MQAYSRWLYAALVPFQSSLADELMGAHGAAIRSAAADFREWLLPMGELPTLHRGVLLKPTAVTGGILPPHKKLMYLSFTESLQVAREFADPDHEMAMMFRLRGIPVEGFLIEYQPSREEVLFSWHWAEAMGVYNFPHVDRATICKQQEVILDVAKRTFPVIPARS